MIRFSKLYRRHTELVVKNDVGLKTLGNKAEPAFYGSLFYKFKGIFGKTSFHDQFKKIIKHYKGVEYSMDVMRQSACLVMNHGLRLRYPF